MKLLLGQRNRLLYYISNLIDAPEVSEIPGDPRADPGGAYVAGGGRDVAGRVGCEGGTEGRPHLRLVLLQDHVAGKLGLGSVSKFLNDDLKLKRAG